MQMIYLPYEWYQFALKFYEKDEILIALWMVFCVNWQNSAYVVILHASLDFFDFFYKPLCTNIYFRNTIRVSNSLDPDQAQYFVGPDCLQKLSTDNTSRQS